MGKKSDTSKKPEKELEELDDDIDPVRIGEEDEISDEIDVSSFFQYQRAINSLIDYLNRSIDDTIAGFTKSDQKLFEHANRKFILNAILESGFYDFCKYRLALIADSDAMNSQEDFLEAMEIVQGEIDLLAYLLVNTRLAHRALNFDFFLSLMNGGLFTDVMEIHSKIVDDMKSKHQSVNKENISTIKVDSANLYI